MALDLDDVSALIGRIILEQASRIKDLETELDKLKKQLEDRQVKE